MTIAEMARPLLLGLLMSFGLFAVLLMLSYSGIFDDELFGNFGIGVRSQEEICEDSYVLKRCNSLEEVEHLPHRREVITDTVR
jgi:hypothetical protein